MRLSMSLSDAEERNSKVQNVHFSRFIRLTTRCRHFVKFSSFALMNGTV
jgi:hypothetical protein